MPYAIDAAASYAAAPLLSLGGHEICGAAYINLRMRAERRRTFEAQLARAGGMFTRHPATRIVAVRGRRLPLHELVRTGRLTRAAYESAISSQPVMGHHMTVGSLGTALSQARAWRMARSCGAPLLVFEDDTQLVGPPGAFEAQLDRALQTTPQSFDLFLLADLAKVQPRAAYAQPVSALVEQVSGEFWGLFGYIVTPRAAQLLLDSLYPIDVQADSYILQNHKSWQLAVFRTRADLVWTNNSVSRQTDAQAPVGAKSAISLAKHITCIKSSAASSMFSEASGSEKEACACVSQAPRGWLERIQICRQLPLLWEGDGRSDPIIIDSHFPGLPSTLSEVETATALMCLASIYRFGGACFGGSVRLLRDYAPLVTGVPLVLATDVNGSILPDVFFGAAGASSVLLLLDAILQATRSAPVGRADWSVVQNIARAALLGNAKISTQNVRILPSYAFDPVTIFNPELPPAFDAYAVGVRRSSIATLPQVPLHLHFVWLAKKLPRFYALLMQHCARRNPLWKVRLWTRADLDPGDPLRAAPAAYASERLRYKIVWEHGGVFLEAGTECVRPLDSFVFQSSAVVISAPGNSSELSSRVFAFAAQHPVALKAASLAADDAYDSSESALLPPHFLRRAIGDDIDKIKVVGKETLASLKTTDCGDKNLRGREVPTEAIFLFHESTGVPQNARWDTKIDTRSIKHTFSQHQTHLGFAA